MLRNLSLPIFGGYTPEEQRMNLFLGFMVHGSGYPRAKNVKLAYNGTINETWFRDYHLMMRLRPSLSLSPHFCILADADVVEFAVSKYTIASHTDRDNTTACICNLIHRGMFDAATHILDIAHAGCDGDEFVEMISDVMVFSDDISYYDRYVIWCSDVIQTTANSYRSCLCGEIPAGLTTNITHRHIHAAAYGNHINLVKKIYFAGADLLAEIWQPYEFGLINEEIFRFACEQEPGSIITEMLGGDADACFNIAMDYVTDTGQLMSKMRLCDIDQLDALIQRHKKLGNTLTHIEKKNMLSNAVHDEEILDCVLQLLHIGTCADIYYTAIASAATSRCPVAIINKLVLALGGALGNAAKSS